MSLPSASDSGLADLSYSFDRATLRVDHLAVGVRRFQADHRLARITSTTRTGFTEAAGDVLVENLSG